MAILKTPNGRNKYFDDNARKDVTRYILNPNKTPHYYCGGIMVELENAHESMTQVAESFGKTLGVKLRHFIIAFEPYEMSDPQIVFEIAQKIVEFFELEYQTVYAVHEGKECLHIHIIINSISYVDGHRYYGTKKEFNSFLGFARSILREYDINLHYVSNKYVCNL